MTEKKNWLSELVGRRIPQILGVYIASVWLGVEVSEWMTERFGVPDQTSSYVAVIMISFLPLVALLAWGHGRPGKDKWTQKQIIFIPFNILIAYFAVTSLIHSNPEVADVQGTQIMALADVNTGELVEYEVAKAGFSQKVTGFFWDNKTGDQSLDWLGYGAMWLVAKDLMRNPIMSIRTPYDSVSMLSAITSKGFERGVGEPLALSLDIAIDRNAQWLIKGEVTKQAGKLTFKAMLYDVSTGAVVTTVTSSFDDWLYALDDVSEQLTSYILEHAGIKDDIIPERSIAEYISSDLAAIEAVINSLNAVKIDNNYTQGVALLKESLESDNQMAEAYVLMMDYYRNMGDLESAKKAGDEALRLEYMLSPETVLQVKANYYVLEGDTEKAVKVLENWVKLYPESADALTTLGSNYIFVGNRLDDALEVYKKLSELQKSNSVALINQARIYRLKDNQEKAIEALQLYAQSHPEKERPLLELADAYLQFGEINQAKENFEQASLLSTNSIKADLGLAKITALQTDLNQGLAAFDGLNEKAVTDYDKVMVLAEKEMILYLAGRLKQAIGQNEVVKELSKSFMSPLQFDITFGIKEVTYLAYLQEFEAAWAGFEELREKLKPPFDGSLGVVEFGVHELAGDFEQAAETLARFELFVESSKLSVYDQVIMSSKAVLADHAGDYNQAIKFHDQAIESSKQSFLTLNSLHILDELIYKKALTQLKMKDYEGVVKSLNDLVKRNPLHGPAKIILAEAKLELGQLDDARQNLDQVQMLWAGADANYKHLIDLQRVAEKLAESAD